MEPLQQLVNNQVLRQKGEALLVATAEGNLQKVQELLDSQKGLTEDTSSVQELINYQCVAPSRVSALHVAAKHGHLDIAEALIAHGANIDMTNKNRHTPLFMASENGHHLLVKHLLTKGAKVVNCQNESWGQCLEVAIWNGHSQCAEAIMNWNFDVDRISKILKVFAEVGYTKCIRLMLDNIPEEFRKPVVNAAYSNGKTALMYVAANRVKLVKMLLKSGAVVNRKDKMGWNELQHQIDLCYYGKSNANIEILIAAGSRFDQTEGSDLNNNNSNNSNNNNNSNNSLTALVSHTFKDKISQNTTGVKSAMSLHEICQQKIRNHLIENHPGSNLFVTVPELGLPKVMTSYLLYDFTLDD